MKTRRERGGRLLGGGTQKPIPVIQEPIPVTQRQVPLAHVGKTPIPVDVVLGRLDEILKEPNHNATCRLYCAEAGLMIEWKSRTRILHSEAFSALMKVAELVNGKLYVMPSDVDVKAISGNSYRVMEVTIRASPVLVYPMETTTTAP